VLAGRQEHLLDQQARRLLALGLRGEVAAQRPQPVGELVAQRLEVAQPEHARTGAARRHRRRGDLRVGGADGGAHLALETGDLVAQRPTGRSLVDLRLDDPRP